MSLSLTKSTLLFAWPDMATLQSKTWTFSRKHNQKFILKLEHVTNNPNYANSLAELISHKSKWHPISLILFGDMLKYRILEHTQGLSPNEFHALMQYHFVQALGAKATHWQCFTQTIQPFQKNIGIAIHKEWLEALQTALTIAQLKFVDIQPAASWLFNHFKNECSANEWFVIHIDQELFIFKLLDFRLSHFKHVKMNPEESITTIVRRELLITGEKLMQASTKIFMPDDDITNITSYKKISTSI